MAQDGAQIKFPSTPKSDISLGKFVWTDEISNNNFIMSFLLDELGGDGTSLNGIIWYGIENISKYE